MWNIQNFLLNTTYLNAAEQEDFLEAHILPPLEGNNKDHKTNSHHVLGLN